MCDKYILVQVGTEAGKYLANVLLNNKVLEHLIVNNCGLEDDGTVAIATGKLTIQQPNTLATPHHHSTSYYNLWN